MMEFPPWMLELHQEKKSLSKVPALNKKSSEAEVAVPDRLLPKSTSMELVRRLKLSQKIGLLLFLHQSEILTPGGQERLLYLQAKAPLEAMEAALKFTQKLQESRKMQSDFKHQMIELNRRPQSKHFRQIHLRRIGVGYRDRGNLPERDSFAQARAQEEAFIFLDDLPSHMRKFFHRNFQSLLTEDGVWLDLSLLTFELSKSLKKKEEVLSFLSPL